MSPGSKNRSSSNPQRRLAARKQNLFVRARMIQAIRKYFIENDYLEVETPQIIPAPSPEVHIEAVRSGNQFLHTSPEICMKRMLSAGYPKIFQISKCFREGERGDLHLPEFTLLEWYQKEIDYNDLMKDCEALILWVSQNTGFGERIRYQGIDIDLKAPWRRISVSEAFYRYASVSLKDAVKRGVFDELMATEIEPKLGVSKPTFLYDYPVSQAAMARLKSDNPECAERFEIFIGGLELANGFSELTDPQEQRNRFERDLRQRRTLGKEAYPMAESFLKSLEHMPEAAGIALGIDRLSMIFANSNEIDHVVSFTPEEL